MSFSDQTQQYLLVRPPQSLRPGTHTSHNLQIQRLINPHPPSSTEDPTIHLPRGHILPILNLETHSIRKTRIVDLERNATLCKFNIEPSGVLGKWQVEPKTPSSNPTGVETKNPTSRSADHSGGWIFTNQFERFEWSKGRTSKGEDSWTLTTHATRRRSTLSDSRTVRNSHDYPVEGLEARVVLMAPSPPMMIVSPRVVEKSVNKQEVMDVLVMGLWIVWREGVVEETADKGTGRRNSWSKGSNGKVRKRGVLDVLLCRG